MYHRLLRHHKTRWIPWDMLIESRNWENLRMLYQERSKRRKNWCFLDRIKMLSGLWLITKMMLKILQGREIRLRRSMASFKNQRSPFVKKTRVKIRLRWVINQFKASQKINQAQSPKISSETNPKNSHPFNHLQPCSRQNNNQPARLNSNL